ncbi:MAG TPA: branched-chain amino acid ABC transporter permease, partial [Planctomycetota bacterium]|nr:branched-chain amino acid ABC transporter permease [Planctomycetota bacterium]
MDLNFATISNHLILIGIYCILALSLNLINGSLGTFSLGHHGFWAMGAYAAGVMVWVFGSPHGSLLMFGLSFLVAMLASAGFGLLVGAPCLRLRGDYLAIATLGFAEIFIICVRNSESWRMFGERGLGGAAGFSLSDTYRDTPYRISGDDLSGNDIIMAMAGGSNTTRQIIYLVVTWVLVALVFIVIRNLLRSGHGRAITAIRDDQTAAELMGVNLVRYKVSVFVIGAAMAGLAGALMANYRSTISPNQFLMMEGIKILLMCVLGGLGSMSGTLIAVFVLYTSEQVISLFQTPVPFSVWNRGAGAFRGDTKSLSDLWQVVFALLLILLMLLRPNGIMGRRELSRE